MLDGGNGKAIAVAKHSTECDARHIAVIGAKLSAFGIAVGKKEPQTRVAISRIKRDGDRCPAMNPRARK